MSPSRKRSRPTRNSQALWVKRSKANNRQSPDLYVSRFNPFPGVHVARLNYTTKVSLITIANSGVAPTHWFRANSIWDPDYSGTVSGNQPYGHDTYQSIYNHYQVLSSTITAQGTSQSTSFLDGIGISMDDDGAASSGEVSAREICSRKGSTYRVGSKYGGMGTVVSRTFSTNYFVNKSNQQCPFGANPGDGLFFGVFALNDEEAATQEVMVSITYTVKMWELKDLTTA